MVKLLGIPTMGTMATTMVAAILVEKDLKTMAVVEALEIPGKDLLKTMVVVKTMKTIPGKDLLTTMVVRIPECQSYLL
jgi:hypothetical protein